MRDERLMRVRDKTRDLFVELMIRFWGSEAGSNFLAQDFKGRNDATILLQSHFVPPRPTQSNHLVLFFSLSVFFSPITSSGFCSPLTHSTKKTEVLLLPAIANQPEPHKTKRSEV